MKRFFQALLLCLFLVFAVSGSAVTTTVGSVTVNAGTSYPGTICTLRLYSSITFTASDGTPVMAGTPGTGAFFKSVTCTISAGIISIPSFAIPSTTDALDNQSARYTAVFYDSKGIKRDTYFADFQIPTTLGTTVTWAQLRVFKSGVHPILDQNTYTKGQVDALIAIGAASINDASDVVKGRTRLSVAPASASAPIAVGSNDPSIPAFVLHASKYATLDAANTAINAAGGGTLVVDTITAVSTTVTIAPATKLLIQGQGQIHGVGGVQAVSIQGPIDAPPSKWIGSNVVVDFTGNHRLNTIYPEWWGAVADSVSDSFTAIQAAEVALETLKSGRMEFGSGSTNASYNVSAPVIITHAKGITWHGNGPDNTRIVATGGDSAVRTLGMFRSTFEGIFFTTSAAIAGKGVFELDGETDGTFGTQGNTFQNCYFNAALLAPYAFAINRVAGSAGQGSENLFLNSRFDQATTACYFQTGFNALNNTILGGNLQHYPLDGISIIAGSISVDSAGFQSEFQYAQVANGGFDIHVGEAGAGEKIVIQNCRTESLQFVKSSSTQSIVLIGNTQNSSAITVWQAAANYHVIGTEMLKQVVVGGSTVWRLFSLTTMGISGLVEPAWPPSGTITDGAAVWTQRTFYSVDTISISGDGQNNYAALNNGFLSFHFAGWSDPLVTAGATITSSFTIARENISHPQVTFYVDATAANVTITSPILANGQVLILKKTDTSSHTVTLAGTGGALVDGGASVSIPGGTKGWLAVQYSTESGGNNFNILASSDARTLNGGTFSSPLPIGNVAPAAGTFTALIGTSLAVTGTPISSSATGLLGAFQLMPINITTATVAASSTSYVTSGASAGAGEVNRQIPMSPCVVRNLRVNIVNTTPAAGTVVITIRKNGVDTAITQTMPAGSTAAVFSDLTHSATFASNDLLSISLTNNDGSNAWTILGTSISYEVVRQ